MTRRLAVAVAGLALLSALPAGVPAAETRHLSARHALGAPSTAASTAPYAVSHVLDGKPVRWDPCTPIHWQYRTSGQVRGGFPVVQRAVREIAKATGTTWVYDGAVRTAPTTAALPRSRSARAPVLIGWTSAGASDLLRGQPRSVVAVTRHVWFGTVRDGKTTAAIKGAVVALDHTQRLPLTGPLSWQAVLLHELGHAVGLDHVSDRRQLMSPVMRPAVFALGAGDRAGLRRLGREAGCIRF